MMTEEELNKANEAADQYEIQLREEVPLSQDQKDNLKQMGDAMAAERERGIRELGKPRIYFKEKPASPSASAPSTQASAPSTQASPSPAPSAPPSVPAPAAPTAQPRMGVDEPSRGDIKVGTPMPESNGGVDFQSPVSGAHTNSLTSGQATVPVYDVNGNITAWISRDANGNVSPAAEPKSMKMMREFARGGRAATIAANASAWQRLSDEQRSRRRGDFGMSVGGALASAFENVGKTEAVSDGNGGMVKRAIVSPEALAAINQQNMADGNRTAISKVMVEQPCDKFGNPIKDAQPSFTVEYQKDGNVNDRGEKTLKKKSLSEVYSILMEANKQAHPGESETDAHNKIARMFGGANPMNWKDVNEFTNREKEEIAIRQKSADLALRSIKDGGVRADGTTGKAKSLADVVTGVLNTPAMAAAIKANVNDGITDRAPTEEEMKARINSVLQNAVTIAKMNGVPVNDKAMAEVPSMQSINDFIMNGTPMRAAAPAQTTGASPAAAGPSPSEAEMIARARAKRNGGMASQPAPSQDNGQAVSQPIGNPMQLGGVGLGNYGAMGVGQPGQNAVPQPVPAPVQRPKADPFYAVSDDPNASVGFFTPDEEFAELRPTEHAPAKEWNSAVKALYGDDPEMMQRFLMSPNGKLEGWRYEPSSFAANGTVINSGINNEAIANIQGLINRRRVYKRNAENRPSAPADTIRPQVVESKPAPAPAPVADQSPAQPAPAPKMRDPGTVPADESDLKAADDLVRWSEENRVYPKQETSDEPTPEQLADELVNWSETDRLEEEANARTRRQEAQERDDRVNEILDSIGRNERRAGLPKRRAEAEARAKKIAEAEAKAREIESALVEGAGDNSDAETRRLSVETSHKKREGERKKRETKRVGAFNIRNSNNS